MKTPTWQEASRSIAEFKIWNANCESETLTTQPGQKAHETQHQQEGCLTLLTMPQMQEKYPILDNKMSVTSIGQFSSLLTRNVTKDQKEMSPVRAGQTQTSPVAAGQKKVAPVRAGQTKTSPSESRLDGNVNTESRSGRKTNKSRLGEIGTIWCPRNNGN